jgi:hypothetical protein
LLVPATYPGVADERHTAEAEQLCNYCQDYTDAAMAAGSVRIAYQVGIGYPDETEIARLVDVHPTGTPGDGRR